MSTVAVVGLGYVGLPLVVEFGKLGRTIGFDIVAEKVAKCRAGTDPSREIPDAEMALAAHAEYTCDPHLLADADFVIVAVPTPVTEAHIPDLRPLLGASRAIGPHLKRGATVVRDVSTAIGAACEVTTGVSTMAVGSWSDVAGLRSPPIASGPPFARSPRRRAISCAMPTSRSPVHSRTACCCAAIRSRSSKR